MKWIKDAAREKTVRILKFDELNPEQQKKVIENYRNGDRLNDTYGSYASDIVGEKQTELEGYGFVNPVIGYTGFWSQGDGASFTAAGLDIRTFLNKIGKSDILNRLDAVSKEMDLDIVDNTSVKLSRVGRYMHENSIEVSVDYQGSYPTGLDEKIGKDLNAIEDLIKEFQKEKAREVYEELQASNDGVYSDDFIKDEIKANDYEFSEDTLEIE